MFIGTIRLAARKQARRSSAVLRDGPGEGTLTEEDLVRKGMTGEWVRAGTVSEIHARARTIAVDVPTEPERTTIDVKRSSRLNDVRLSLLYAISGAIGSVVDRLSLIRTVAGYVIRSDSDLFDWNNAEMEDF